MIKSIDKYGLGVLNAWKIQLSTNEKFIITPAHNILYKVKDNKNNTVFNQSPFVPEKYNTNWYIPRKYINSTEYDLMNDIAYMPLDNNSLVMKSKHINEKNIYKINYYYYQPYDYMNNKSYNNTTNNTINNTTNNYQLGCGQNIIYNSPGTEYFEGINFGFRGMSGSAITDVKSNYFIGLFIRKISNLGINKIDSTLQTEMIGVSRGFVMPVKQIEKLIYSKDNIKIN
jgi:hypothetical protein